VSHHGSHIPLTRVIQPRRPRTPGSSVQCRKGQWAQTHAALGQWPGRNRVSVRTRRRMHRASIPCPGGIPTHRKEGGRGSAGGLGSAGIVGRPGRLGPSLKPSGGTTGDDDCRESQWPPISVGAGTASTHGRGAGAVKAVRWRPVLVSRCTAFGMAPWLRHSLPTPISSASGMRWPQQPSRRCGDLHVCLVLHGQS